MSRLIRALCLLLCLLLPVCCLAEEAPALRGYSKADGYVYVSLGRFEQTAESEVLPIVWRVLSTDGSEARLCSEYVLLAHRIHDDYKAYERAHGDFAMTEMCQFLNGEFSERAFTEDELALLVPHEQYGKVYLLTSADLNSKELGFGSDKNRKAWATPYAIEVTDVFVYGRKYGSHTPYWVMDQSTTNRQGARCVKQAGNLGYINVITLNEGCRPTCVLDLTKIRIIGGSGTLEDPYQIGTAVAEAE